MQSFKIQSKKPGLSSVPGVLKSSVQASSRKAFLDDDDRQEDEPDYIDGLDGTKILSKNQKKKAEKNLLVIPLITKNEWRIDENKLNKEKEDENVVKENAESISVQTEKEPESLQDQAVKELLEEASTKGSSSKKSKTIPILFQNRVPDGYEEDDNMDVSLRPDQSSLDDYERIPIEEFGLAMLRGMGWKETEGIGLKNKKVVDMTEPKLRPKGMGLGAEAAHLNKDVAPKNSSATNEEREDLVFKIGAHAVITKGSKKGYYGQIESFDEDNNRVIMKLGISGKMETVSKFYINLVSAKEYKKNSKVINSEKYEEYKAKQDKKDKLRHEEEYTTQDSEEESRRRKVYADDSSRSDEEEDEYRRSKSKTNVRELDDEYRKSEKRSGHRDRDDVRSSKNSDKDRKRRDDRDRDYSSRHDSRRYDDRDRDRSRNCNDDYHRNSSRNGDRERDRGERGRDSSREYHHSRKDDRSRRRRD